MTNRAIYDFTGTTVLITGGTSGIGHATAVGFRDAGAQVTVTGTRPSPGDYDVDLSGIAYHQVILGEGGDADRLAGAFPALDVLINNAGANFPGGRDEATAEGFTASVQLNLLGPARLTLALHPALKVSRANGGASVLMLGSMAALRAVTLVPGYGSAKAGVLALTRTLAMRWARDRIRVNAVVPGVIDTPMSGDDRRRRAEEPTAAPHPDAPDGHRGGGRLGAGLPVHRKRLLHHGFDADRRRRIRPVLT